MTHVLTGPTVDQWQTEADLYQALAHPVRLAIQEVLLRDEECVCHLTALFQKPQAYMSQQLAVLREAGLVMDRKDGLRVFYRLHDQRLGVLLGEMRRVAGLGVAVLPLNERVGGCECPKCAR